MKKDEQKTECVWHELESKKEEFQKIVRLLVDFDETTGRYRRYGDPETHFMRRSVSVADADRLRIFLCPLGGFVYYIVAELQSGGGCVSTGWVHEDGIRAERDEFREEKAHPVHSIVCMTDLFEQFSVKMDGDFSLSSVSAQTIELFEGTDNVRGKIHSH